VAGLPAQPGQLVGRGSEVALVRSRLAQTDARLLTLTGVAGTGKTRLAVEVAGQVGGAFADGTYFVDLAPINDPALVPTAIAQALDIREERGGPVLEVLKQQLAARQTLVVLDNFEQLLPAAPQLSELLESCPDLKLLVTSRSALRLRWELVIPVPPLADVAAVELFVQRAQAADPSFELNASNAATITEICVSLDGLPLAIELAAARTRVLPPHALLSRLGHRLDVLTVPGPDRAARQRTLRAALDWSYELLSPAEQALFRRLGVFVGGFPLSAVAEVCDPDGALGLDPLLGVESLLDKSLIRSETGSGQAEPRFGMLETVREYARERLVEAGELDLLRRRHAQYFLGGADVPVTGMQLTHQSVWLQTLEAEHQNLRAALTWCEEARTPDLGLRAASLLAWFWIVRGHVAEGRRQLTALTSMADTAPPELQAAALRVVGSLALHQADDEAARRLFESSLAIRRGLGDPAGMLSSLSSLGAVALQQGDVDRAERYFTEALAIQEAIGDNVGIAESTNSLANLAHERGDLARARALYERSLELQHSRVRYRPDIALHNLGIVAQEQGDLDAARRHFQDSVAIKRSLGDTHGLALSLAKLAEVLASMGEAVTAHRLLCESLNLQRDLGDRPAMAFVLDRFAMAAAARDRPLHSLRIAAAADALREAIGSPLSPAAREYQERWLAPVRARLRPDGAAAAWQAGHGLTLEQITAEVLVFDAASRGEPPERDAVSQLSAREREVATLVAQGLSNRDIAQRLVVSERTAENHVQHVLNRLGLRSRAQVAAWAVQNGLTEPT
jgi:predicted ATPase/DNA-binding CsgD family transcriptional regulator